MIKISIITPSYNQNQFIEETILSVINQNYGNIEYIIIDGNSTDKSQDTIRRYENKLAYWISEPDKGQYDAINKGFSHSTGDIMTWINADDMYTPWAFSIVSEIFSTFPEIEWITTLYQIHWDKRSRPVKCFQINGGGGYSRKGFYRGENLPGTGRYSHGWIQQESTFWRRSLWERAGGYLDTSYKLAADFELWARFFKFTELYSIGSPLGGFRVHENQKTAFHYDAYVSEAMDILNKYGGKPHSYFGSLFRNKFNSHIPSLLKFLAYRLGILYPQYKCIYSARDGLWEIVQS
ncbi:glycosyltransferase family 2 protein [Thermodesulfobacteriota bacterium]